MTTKAQFQSFRDRYLDFWGIVTILSILVFGVLLVYPLIRLVVASFMTQRGTFAGSGEFSLIQTYVEFFTVRYYYQTMINSFFVSTLATVFAVLIGVPVAYLIYRIPIPGKLLIRVAIVLTFVSPPFIGAYAWVLLLGRTGVITQWLQVVGITLPSIYGWRGIVLVFTLQAFPFVFLLVSSGLRSIDQSLEDAAINMGRSPFGVFRTVILPLIVPSISTGALLVFVTTFSDFGTPSIIGEGFRVLAALIYQEFVNEFGGNPRRASTLAILMLAVTITALLVQRWFAKRTSFDQEAVVPLGIRRTTRRQTILASAFVYIVVFAAFLPTLTIVVSSFLESRGPLLIGTFSLEGYRSAARLPMALRNSLVFVFVSTLLCVVMGTLMGYVVARRKNRVTGIVDTLSMTPYAVAGVVMGVSLAITYGGAPFFLSGSSLILIMAYFIRRLPYSVRSVSGLLYQMGPDTEEASVNLGVPPGRTFWRVTLPQITPAVLSGALLTMATIAREFNSTVILYSGRTRTLPVEVFAQVLQGNFGAASVVGTVLIVMTLVPIVILFMVFGKNEQALL
ncbi:MAG: iron ABC transporter permease [Alkalispirochaeta sp.]